ncbi:SHARK [Mytilus edulis]|uniref:Tyrosine-protein kinase n=1 Tax=Mytilus edulis TaxID=6550 RepID=A0A8S3SQZ9_MYTED|nr:SHARK [Mytilus edulis]
MSHEEENDTIYANEDITKVANISKLLQNFHIDKLLENDKKEIERLDENVKWYHKKIPRDTAEQLLKEGLAHANMDGMFLIRDSTSSTQDYVVSVTHKGKVYHFQIKEIYKGHYQIDEGPIVHGLDKLVTHYQSSPNGLITQLTQHCCAEIPPNKARQLGQTNVLHRAVVEGIADQVRKILNHRLCPDINAKTSWGSTCLHDAANYGFEEIVKILIEKEADVEMIDKAGFTALHRACVTNRPNIVKILIEEGKSDVQLRCPKTGWVALHVAAYKGHKHCIQELLNHHAPLFPRAEDGSTPYELAKRYNRTDCLQILNFPDYRSIRTRKELWFHSHIDRKTATMLLEAHQSKEGLFLVRKNKKDVNYHVITVCHKHHVFNYEVKVKDFRGQLVHYIDDGPLFDGLERLVEHYHRTKDGLITLHTTLHVTAETVQPLISEDLEDYYNVPDNDEDRPKLPPRHDSPAEEIYETADDGDVPATPPPLPSSQPPPKKSISVEPKEPKEPREPKEEEKEVWNIIDKKDIKILEKLGEGEYGEVKKGKYTRKDAKGKNAHKIDVAIKTFHAELGNDAALKSIKEEAKLMSQLKHECIVELFGVCDSPFMLVEEYIPEGSMLDYLVKYGSKKVKVDSLKLWAAQIANGMQYLEKKRVVHRDLAARNILVMTLMQVKISDFGLSRAYSDESSYYKASKGGRWPIKWYAPECVNYGKFTHATDVWSYGVTLWEMFSYGDQPYGDKKGIEVIQFIEEGSRLEKPDACPDVTYIEMKKCWMPKPDERPTFHELSNHFETEKEYADIRDFKRSKDSSHSKKKK